MSIKRALISVSNKDGIVAFARELSKNGVEIISTGGTFTFLKNEGIKVSSITDVTQFPEILDGRVKTLHPLVHGGILGIRDEIHHQKEMDEHHINPFDLVVVNLYPFVKTRHASGVSEAEIIENIDIGGPTLIRAAAKNYRFVTVVVDPKDYDKVISEMNQTNGSTKEAFRYQMARKAFNHTASYDSAIATYFNERENENEEVAFEEVLTLSYKREKILRYGENPHQKAAFYTPHNRNMDNLFTQLHGKELSYNNIQDCTASLSCLSEFSRPTVVAIKHMNPCGVAEGNTLEDAYQKCYASDPVSIFGGIVGCNRPVDKKTASFMKEIFLECILAPSFTEEALSILKEKKNLRIIKVNSNMKPGEHIITSAHNGILIQERDVLPMNPEEYQVKTYKKPSQEEWVQLLFAFKVVKHVKSNAIVIAKKTQVIGVGAGQMNRVGAAVLALNKAGEEGRGAVMASDAFFPMPDTVEKAHEYGVRAIIQPGGSIRDQESIDVANKHGLSMVFTGTRHFKH